ncbi:hypothetical protein GCM10010510_49440 [Streptomyces anandii JCM 4720]|nr:hypothetical protein GCM10010510_49440 [Streptomyces anandii JCM 4720]
MSQVRDPRAASSRAVALIGQSLAYGGDGGDGGVEVGAEADGAVVGRGALTPDVDTFVARMLAGLDDVPASYARMGPADTEGPTPVDLTPPGRADAEETVSRLAADEWVVDLRSRMTFAEGHVLGSFDFEGDGRLATCLGLADPLGQARHLARRDTSADRRSAAGAGTGGHRPPGRRRRRIGRLAP